MKRIALVVGACVAFLTLASLPLWHMNTAAGDSGNGCKLLGTWTGELPYPQPSHPNYVLSVTVTIHGTGDNEGTLTVQWNNPVPEPGTSWSPTAQGTWAKSGPNTIKFTAFGYVFDSANGEFIYVVRHSGSVKLTDCNTAVTTQTSEYLDKNMNQLFCAPASVTYRRVVLQEPCQ